MTSVEVPVELTLKLEYGCRHQTLQHQAVRAASEGWQWQLRHGRQIVHLLFSATRNTFGTCRQRCWYACLPLPLPICFSSFIDLAGI